MLQLMSAPKRWQMSDGEVCQVHTPFTTRAKELMDREADMLNRGRSDASLSGLRKRLANLFLQFIETPEFNPEAARFQKTPAELLVKPNTRPMRDAGDSRGLSVGSQA